MSSSSTPYRKIRNRITDYSLPIYYWWYTPTVYELKGNVSVYQPTFSYPIAPLVELQMLNNLLLLR